MSFSPFPRATVYQLDYNLSIISNQECAMNKSVEQLIVVRETREGEGRVALTPTTVADLRTRFPKIMIENNAGFLAGFSDEDYMNAGANIFTVDKTPFPLQKLELPVQMIGRREDYQELIESYGIQYYVLPEKNQTAFLNNYLSLETIIIAAIRTIGQKTTILMDESSLANTPENAVIIDLCTGEGGAVIGSKEDAVIKTERGISIVTVSGYPKAEPRAASEAFAKCMVHLLLDITTPQREINTEHELLWVDM